MFIKALSQLNVVYRFIVLPWSNCLPEEYLSPRQTRSTNISVCKLDDHLINRFFIIHKINYT